MEWQHKHHQAFLSEPLLLPSTSSPVQSVRKPAGHCIKAVITSSSDIVYRFVCIILIRTISLWANYEASKGFAITVINDAGDSFAGKRFSHFYISDDKATRIVFGASKFVENILYPSDHEHRSVFFKKQVNHVILRLANVHNMSTNIIVESRANNEYVLHLNPSIMEHKNFNHDIVSAIQRGMARVWLWDGHGTVPKPLTNGMIEYIISWNSQPEFINSSKNSPEADMVTEMLVNCVKKTSGFVRELNQAMRDHWQDSTFDYSVDAKTHSNFCNYKFND
ncbi:hypothetical protein AgCh_013958 [Apium graveolens]